MQVRWMNSFRRHYLRAVAREPVGVVSNEPMGVRRDACVCLRQFAENLPYTQMFPLKENIIKKFASQNKLSLRDLNVDLTETKRLEQKRLEKQQKLAEE